MRDYLQHLHKPKPAVFETFTTFSACQEGFVLLNQCCFLGVKLEIGKYDVESQIGKLSLGFHYFASLIDRYI